MRSEKHTRFNDGLHAITFDWRMTLSICYFFVITACYPRVSHFFSLVYVALLHIHVSVFPALIIPCGVDEKTRAAPLFIVFLVLLGLQSRI